MTFEAIDNAKDLIEIFISCASVLGGSMAYSSGRAAVRSAREGAHPAQLADAINRGLAQGFNVGLPGAGLAAILLIVS